MYNQRRETRIRVTPDPIGRLLLPGCNTTSSCTPNRSITDTGVQKSPILHPVPSCQAWNDYTLNDHTTNREGQVLQLSIPILPEFNILCFVKYIFLLFLYSEKYI